MVIGHTTTCAAPSNLSARPSAIPLQGRREVEQVLGREAVPLSHTEFQALLAGVGPNTAQPAPPPGSG